MGFPAGQRDNHLLKSSRVRQVSSRPQELNHIKAGLGRRFEEDATYQTVTVTQGDTIESLGDTQW